MKKIKFGMVGLGRLGIQHAENIAFKIPEAELTAICAIEEERVEEIKTKWGVPYGYTDFDEMIKNNELDAVFLCSPSHLHCDQIEKALEAGLHVFSEKPLGTTLEECKRAEKAIENHPDKVFMLGFMRRYDPSYVYAKKMIDQGKIGKPFLFRGYSQDPESAIAGAIAYAGHSGGQFIDMAVHDIDLSRWLLDSEPIQTWGIGGCYKHDEFGKHKDGDNVSALLKFKNDAMAFIFAGRTAPHGYNVETEIIGTEGILRIANVPQKNLVEVLDPSGVRKECSQDFLERFETAYVDELKEFVDCIINKRKPEVTVYDGTRTTIVAYACKESFETGKLIDIQEN
ncbi:MULTISPECIES: inositol 2-dehydrogenase [Psychrilyobacter]|uniref:Inositol 2-dehydrogenase n=1 Tax=Psychrilyobacter piezotolerans TaxID=2293438 RepID=A0ABX9KGL4_9FUSO|nr:MULTISPECIES: inositol 2-dehydrogenase [Psychrilyobacter]MCS5421990.1 inositol 2-dehydrogenase [Psychrilyobacter sp. S5]NDI77724.1 inositol 2-dehydrogenase [Psychrilyobacter piezotolerans]RDE61422.1 inositol 2-dehydrogenase [Psychrilyobacter sp. S5]REI40943.1 inositol 2-dehydrogenase [Psychrilyobacter piezotolerans]